MPGKLELTTLLTRVMLPFLTTVAVAVAMMGMLNSLRRFFIPSLSPAMFNVATILCAFALVPVMPRLGLPPILAIAIGTLLGGLGQMAIQWPALRKEGFRYRPILDFSDPELREVLRLMGPGTLGVAAVKINVLVNTYLATEQEPGAVSWLDYAFRLMYLPIGLFGVSIATAALPDIARHAAAEDTPAMRETVSSALRMMLMLNVPATVGLIALADPIVALLLSADNSHRHDTAATAAALMFYSPGLLGYSAVKIASPTLLLAARQPDAGHGQGDVGLANLVLNLVAGSCDGLRGLALGTALAAMVQRRRRCCCFFAGASAGWKGGAVARRVLEDPRRLDRMGRRAADGARGSTDGFPATSADAGGPRRRRHRRRRSSRSWPPHVCCGSRSSRGDRPGTPAARAGPAMIHFVSRSPRLHPTILLHRQRPHHGRRLRQHLRAAAAAAHPAARSLARRGGHADDAVPAGGVGAQVGFGHLADRWRPRAARDGGPDRVGRRSELRRARRRRCRCSRRS